MEKHVARHTYAPRSRETDRSCPTEEPKAYTLRDGHHHTGMSRLYEFLRYVAQVAFRDEGGVSSQGSADSVPESFELGPISVKPGRNRPNWARSGPTSTRVGPGSANTPAQLRPTLARSRPDIGQTSAKAGPESTEHLARLRQNVFPTSARHRPGAVQPVAGTRQTNARNRRPSAKRSFGPGPTAASTTLV